MGFSRRTFLKGAATGLVATGALAGAGTVTAYAEAAVESSAAAGGAPATSGATSASGTFSASAQGIGGDVTVTLTIEGDTLVEASAEGPGETDGIGTRALETMPQEMLARNTVAVDGVSGATITSNAVLQAAADALAQSGATLTEVEAAPVEQHMTPGTYYGEAYGKWAEGTIEGERFGSPAVISPTRVAVEVDDDLPLDDVLDVFLNVEKNADCHDYSADGINRNLTAVAYLFLYVKRLDAAGLKRYESAVEQARQHAFRYLDEMPGSQYPRVASYATWELSMMSTAAKETETRRMLGSILAGHKQTYVHSLMVAKLTRALIRLQIKMKPETLVGLLDCKDAAEVQARKDELCQTAYECGLYHDIGKSAVVMYIDNNARRLLDEEFLCIQSHPFIGSSLLNRMGYDKTLAPAALYHHCFYNGQGGYPGGEGPCPQYIKGIVDALSVADSLDAATDNIGRCYNAAKPFRKLLEELRAQSGTRYAPSVVELFNDEGVCAAVDEELDTERKKVYLQVYHVDDDRPLSKQ